MRSRFLTVPREIELSCEVELSDNNKKQMYVMRRMVRHAIGYFFLMKNMLICMKSKFAFILWVMF